MGRALYEQVSDDLDCPCKTMLLPPIQQCSSGQVSNKMQWISNHSEIISANELRKKRQDLFNSCMREEER